MEFFSTLHIETKKDVSINEVSEEIVAILNEKGYQVVGVIGNTEIVHKGKKLSDDCHNSYVEHYKSIKNAW